MPVLAPTTPSLSGGILSFSDLQGAIASWLHRTDLAALIPTFIMLAEQRMNGDLDARAMEVRTTLTCTPGPTTAARQVALPSDMTEMKRLLLVDSDPATVLEYKSPDQLVADNLFLLRTGRPDSFTVIGPNIELSPAPDQAYPLELVYQQRIPPLSNSNTSNWVLAQNPSIYLFGALLASIVYTQDESKEALYERKYKEAVETINGIDWYSGSTMRVKAR
jgi:hypothetical protein